MQMNALAETVAAYFAPPAVTAWSKTAPQRFTPEQNGPLPALHAGTERLRANESRLQRQPKAQTRLPKRGAVQFKGEAFASSQEKNPTSGPAS